MRLDENIATLRARNSHDELERINRLTGLRFDELPESLLGRQEDWEGFAEALLGVARDSGGGDNRR
ncbi:MAG TPA: hypothetical protein PK031_09805, partial [Pseudomonadales bacterium]|nr:hypothetical protein [Pseudomonadales bacterium]